MNTSFVPSTEWQDVPDWAVLPSGGEYRLDPNSNIRKARWDPPVPGPETVIDKRTLPGANGQQPSPQPPPATSPQPAASTSSTTSQPAYAQSPLSSWFNIEEVKDLPEREPVQIIKGLLYVGQKLGITAGSKKFKSWLLLYLAYCLANGLPVLGFETRKSKVAIIDFELLRFSLRRRLSKIQQALGQAGHHGNFDNLRIIALRGKARKFWAELPSICDELRAAGFEVVIIDPVYKLLLGQNENSNALVAEILEKLTEFCMETDVSLIHVQHHSKGNQAAKEAIDRASGAGSFGRDADTIIDFVDHEQWTKADQIFSVSVIVREFPPIDDFVVHWNFPLLVRDTSGPSAIIPPRGMAVAEAGGIATVQRRVSKEPISLKVRRSDSK